jgi:integrase
MQRDETTGHAARFLPVHDSRKRIIRGLWRRNDRYYAQLRMEGEDGLSKPKRIPLGIMPLDQARQALERVRTENRSRELALPNRRPKFTDFADQYLASAIHGAKRPGTRGSERVILEYWKKHLGGTRLDRISAVQIKGYREKRLGEGVTARTVNKETVAFYQVLKLAVDRGLITSFSRVRQLKQKPAAKRPLLSPADVERLLADCEPSVTKNAALLKFYLRFLTLTGAREKEALAIRWEDVDFHRGLVTIGADGSAKTGRHRSVNFSGELESLLHEMAGFRPPDSSFLFPSPQRGERDIAAHSLRESFKLVRSKAGLPWVGFHDLRHFFASQCVMGGLDFMTIASWLGHSDGGVLVGRVYGHLADAHKRRMADGLRILG